MENGIEMKKNIEVTLSIEDVFDEEDFLPDGYCYICKNGLEIHYGYSEVNYEGIIPFISANYIWFPYKGLTLCKTTVTLNDYSVRKEFYEDWEEFYSYLKDRHERKINAEKFKSIEKPLYTIIYTDEGSYVRDISLAIDPSLFWEEPTTDSSSVITFGGAYGWTFYYNTVPQTVSCILDNGIKEVWFRSNEYVIRDVNCKMSKEAFKEFNADVDEFVYKHLNAKVKTRLSCHRNLIIEQYPTINSTEIVTKFTFTLPKSIKNLGNITYHIGDWTFFVTRNEDQSAVSFSTKSALLCFSEDNEAVCAYISKEVPQVSELEMAYNDFLDEICTEELCTDCAN